MCYGRFYNMIFNVDPGQPEHVDRRRTLARFTLVGEISHLDPALPTHPTFARNIQFPGKATNH